MRPQSKPRSVTTNWGELPIPVLTQIFQAVCKHGALPMAPRLACVCTSWQAAVAATPELWHILDTAAISSKAWVQQNAHGRSRGPKAPRAKGKASGASAVGFVSAEQGLRRWLEIGRLQQLQVLVLHGEGPVGPTADAALESESSRSGPNRQLSADLLMQIAETCQQLRRVSLFGCLSFRPEVGPQGCTSVRIGHSVAHVYACLGIPLVVVMTKSSASWRFHKKITQPVPTT